MKKICLIVSLLGMVLPVLGAASQMAMVSYFPIPYVAYKNVYVHNQLDVGLGSQCDWNVGNSSLTTVPLQATNLNLYGTLNLQNIATLKSTNTVTLGTTPTGSEDIRLKFFNLRVAESDPFLNMNATYTLEITSGTSTGLRVYADVVSNAYAIMSECQGGVSWQRLTEKDGKEGVYLVCGSVTPGTSCMCDNFYEGAWKSETTCPAGQTGNKTYQCTKSGGSCSWVLKNDSCKVDDRPTFYCNPSHKTTLWGVAEYQPAPGQLNCTIPSTKYFSKSELLKVENQTIYTQSGVGYGNHNYGNYFLKPAGCESGQKCNCEVGKNYIIPDGTYRTAQKGRVYGDNNGTHAIDYVQGQTYSCWSYVDNVQLCVCGEAYY